MTNLIAQQTHTDRQKRIRAGLAKMDAAIDAELATNPDKWPDHPDPADYPIIPAGAAVQYTHRNRTRTGKVSRREDTRNTDGENDYGPTRVYWIQDALTGQTVPVDFEQVSAMPHTQGEIDETYDSLLAGTGRR